MPYIERRIDEHIVQLLIRGRVVVEFHLTTTKPSTFNFLVFASYCHTC